MELTDIQKQMMKGLICPYCSQPSVLVNSEEVYGRDLGMIYLCRPCGAYVGLHKDGRSKGRLANAALRKLKIEVHYNFDRLWKSQKMKRSEAYRWMAEALDMPRKYTHIGMFGEVTCYKVIELTKSKYASL